jgi:hypothetical protein
MRVAGREQGRAAPVSSLSLREGISPVSSARGLIEQHISFSGAMMKREFFVACLLVLSGCGVWSDTIRSDIGDYSSAIGETADKNLLVNILEARDGAPIHSVEMPKITGSLQATASLSATAEAFPTVVNGGTGVLNQSVTPMASVQSSPTFEVDNLDSKDFVTGVTSQIDPKQIQYWFDKGLDRRILLLLFFSSIDVHYRECVRPDADKPLPGQKEAYDICIRRYGTANAECDAASAPQSGTNRPKGEEQELNGKLDRCKSRYPDTYEQVTENCKTQIAVQAKIAASKDPKSKKPPKDKPDPLQQCLEKRVNAEQEIEIHNDPRSAAEALHECQESHDPQQCKWTIPFISYLKVVNEIESRFFAQTYGERTLLGKGVAITPKELAKFDPAKYSVEYLSDTPSKNGSKDSEALYNIYSSSTDKKIALCFGYSPLTKPEVGASDECSQSTVTRKIKTDPPAAPTVERVLPPPSYESQYCEDINRINRHAYCAIYRAFLAYLKNEVGGVTKEDQKKEQAADQDITPMCGELLEGIFGKGNVPTEFSNPNDCLIELGRHYSFTMRIRSAGEILRYVGDLLYYQRKVAQDCDHNIPVTLGFVPSCSKEAAKNTCGDPRCWKNNGGILFDVNLPGEQPRVSVGYRGGRYSIGQVGPSDPPYDHSLEVLSIVNVSINLNKSATDIHPTPTVQVIP